MGPQCDLGHFRNQPTDTETIRADRQVRVRKHVFQLHSVNDRKDPLQQGLGHFKPDEIVVLLRRITILRHLHHVEPELRLQMGRLVLRILDRFAILRP